MEVYYAESLTLEASPRDSVLRFHGKVQHFVTTHPAATDDPLYPDIRQNIRLALILTDPSWEGEDDITFIFGDSANGTNNGTGGIGIDTTWAGYTYMNF